jgi:TolA-binding protein
MGWTWWEEGTLLNRTNRLQVAATAFQTAAEKLTRSDEQALAWFKLGDTHFFLKDPAKAVTNYLAVLRSYNDLPQVRNTLFDKTYAQLIRASLELGDKARAESYLNELRQNFPNSRNVDEGLYFFGQALVDQGEAMQARAVFQDLITNYPASTRVAEARFEEAKTYAVEGEEAAALQKHEEWLGSYTNHLLRPQVEFQRAVLLDKTGQATNALASFSQFATKYPTDPLAPAAQTWVADHYHHQQLWPLAELNYQKVFQNTNWAGTRLAYEARLMSAQTAFRRQGYTDARSYLTNLLNDPRCPAEVQPKAWFALGDVFMERATAISSLPR